MSVTGIKGGELMCEARNATRPQVDDEFTPVRRKKTTTDSRKKSE